MSWLFASGGQSIGASASASVLPMNIQDWFPLGLTGWISLLSKGLPRVFSSTTVWKHQFFGAQPSLWSNSHILKKISRPCLGVSPRDSDWLGAEWGQVTLIYRHQQWERVTPGWLPGVSVRVEPHLPGFWHMLCLDICCVGPRRQDKGECCSWYVIGWCISGRPGFKSFRWRVNFLLFPSSVSVYLGS